MREGTESHINGHLSLGPSGAVSVGGCPCRTPRARAEALAARALFLSRWISDHFDRKVVVPAPTLLRVKNLITAVPS